MTRIAVNQIYNSALVIALGVVFAGAALLSGQVHFKDKAAPIPQASGSSHGDALGSRGELRQLW
jgi:hypothetical protein